MKRLRLESGLPCITAFYHGLVIMSIMLCIEISLHITRFNIGEFHFTILNWILIAFSLCCVGVAWWNGGLKNYSFLNSDLELDWMEEILYDEDSMGKDDIQGDLGDSRQIRKDKV